MLSLEISAVSITPTARAWLTNSHEARVLHVFDSVCNLINERRDVLSVVTPQIGNGPFNIVVEDDVLFSEHLNIESPIFILGNQLTMGSLTINISDAKIWSPRPDWERLHTDRDDIANQLTKLPITNYEVSGLDTLFATTAQGYSTTIFNPKLPITNYQFSNSLISFLSIANISSSLIAAKKLAGLGIGLTPAGDDFILGAIYASWIIHPLDVARVLAEEITNTAAPLTTSLSAAWLRSAGKGEAGILWHQFFDALISSNPAQIQAAMNKILSVGETSGADAIAGFIRLFMCWAEFCSNLWEYNQT